MSSSLIVANLAAYTLQVALLLMVGFGLPRILHLPSPKLRLRYWQSLLAVALLLPVAANWLQPAASTMSLQTTSVWIEATAVAEGDAVAPSRPWQALVWLVVLGACARLAWLFVGLHALRRLRIRSAPLAPLPPALENLAAHLGKKARKARFRISEQVTSPVTFGWLQPLVVVPEAFRSLPEAAQTSVACHELLHVERRDWLWSIGEHLVRAVLWFHPAVWLLLTRIALCREQVVDSEVVRTVGARRSYLEALMTFASPPVRALPVPALPFFHRGHLRQRVSLLTQEVSSMSKRRLLGTTLSLTALLSLTVVVAVMTFPLTTSYAGSSSQPIHVSEDVQPPLKIHSPVPSYPEAARKERIEGPVVVQIVITKEGHVTDLKVVKSMGEALDAAVLEVLPQWKFEPARLNGEVVDVYYNLTINFRLDKQKQEGEPQPPQG